MYRTTLAFLLCVGLASVAYAEKPMRFKTHLEPFNAGGAPVMTNATGQAHAEVIDEGTAVAFRINVAGIRNLLMAHIHVSDVPVGNTDPAGPIAYWFTGGPPPGDVVTERVNGRLAEGFIITGGDLEDWTALPDTVARSERVGLLIDAIKEGRATIVVHTDDLDPNTPTGVAGDSRAGEIRGTLR